MHRLFVALRPPAAMRGRLLALMGGIPGVRWQEDAQLHLTLRFIGEVDGRQADDIVAALGSVSGPRPLVALQGVGSFDRKGVAHTLYAGVAPDPALLLLRQRIDAALARIGLPPDARAFRPHITLARLNRSAGDLGDFLHRAGTIASEAAELDAFLLYESLLGHEGATYNAVARYPLR